MIPAKGYATHHAKDRLSPWAFERREPGENDVQIKILYCGVCHSDIHQARSEWGPAKYPMIPGHEIVGRVVRTGKNAVKYKAGELVGIGCMVDSCRECNNCRHGLEQYCEKGATVWTYNSFEKDGKTLTFGGYSDIIVADESFILKVPENLPTEGVAPLLCAGITTWSPLRKWKVGKGHKVGILGLGGLGHMGVKLASSFGAEVTMLSTSRSKEQDARRLGAHHFCYTKDEQEVRKFRNYFDFILDTVSAPHDHDMYLKMLGTNGTFIIVGVPPEPLTINAGLLRGNSRTVTGSNIGGIPETQEMLDYCGEHGIVSDVEVINISYINEAYERVIASDVKYRFVIDLATL